MSTSINTWNIPGLIGKSVIKYQYALVLIILLTVAFLRNQAAVKGNLYGYYGYDTDRDLGSVHNLLEGNFGKDPSLIGEYLWYNPLITYVEFVLIKVTGLSPEFIVIQSGPFLNLLCPVFFYIMLLRLFNPRVALASTAALVFFTTGDMNSIFAATYSPWNYAGTFSQSLFYLGIISIHKAFTKPGYFTFAMAGLITGITFLGHSAPAILLTLIIVFLYIKNIIPLFRMNAHRDILNHLSYGVICGIIFLVASLPLLYYVFGKYQLHMLNHEPAQWSTTGVEFANLPHLIHLSLTFSFFVALIGVYDFLRSKKIEGINRKIIIAWFSISSCLYIYTNIVSILRIRYGVILPGIVPSFHFIFYLKSLQSVLFGVGFCFLAEIIILRFFKNRKISSDRIIPINPLYYTVPILLISLLYYPIYTERPDFFYNRVDRPVQNVEVYHWLLRNTHINDVVVSEETASLFPVMASGRKVVSSHKFMVNPYVRYEERANDNNIIITYLNKGDIEVVNKLLEKYNVKYILLDNSKILKHQMLKMKFGNPVFLNEKFSIYIVGNEPLN